jgi:hypothetical protein
VPEWKWWAVDTSGDDLLDGLDQVGVDVAVGGRTAVAAIS